MAWTAPATYVASAVLTAANLNLVRDNLIALKDPPSNIVTNSSMPTAITTNSTTFVDASTTYLQAVITTVATSDIAVGATFTLNCNNVAGTYRNVYFDLMRNGTSVSGANGIHRAYGDANMYFPVTLFWWLPAIAAGTHTIKLRWRVVGTATALITLDTHYTQFWAREMS